MTRPLVFAPATMNLAETTRMVELAKAVRDHFEIVFTSYGGDFEELVREAGFVVKALSPRFTPEKIERFYAIDRGEVLGNFFTDDELERRLDGEVAFFDEVRPLAVVTGFCLSVSVSARAAGVPLVWVIGSPWLEQYFRAGLGTWPDVLDFPWLRFLPDRWLDRLAGYVMPFMYRLFFRQFSRAARRRGLPRFRGTEFWEGDYALLAEPPEFAGLTGLGPKYRFIGPLIAHLNAPIPPEVASMPRDLPIVYFAMGSSGNPDLVAGILEGFEGKPYRVIAPVKALVEKRSVRVPSNVVITGLLPADRVNPMADLSLIHGGVGTVMTACLAGTPVVGVGMQPEQEANLECLVRKGMAVRIRKRRATPEAVLAAVDRLLADREARQRALQFKKVVEAWDGPTEAAHFLLETFKENSMPVNLRAR